MNNKKTKLKSLATLLSLSLMTTSLTGCDQFSYSKDEEGNIILEGNISYARLVKGYKLIEVECFDENRLYIAEIVKPAVGNDRKYCDIFTSAKICTYSNIDNSSIKLIAEKDLNDYLVFYDLVKKEYNENDIKDLLDKIKEDYTFTSDDEYTTEKVLVKE